MAGLLFFLSFHLYSFPLLPPFFLNAVAAAHLGGFWVGLPRSACAWLHLRAAMRRVSLSCVHTGRCVEGSAESGFQENCFQLLCLPFTPPQQALKSGFPAFNDFKNRLVGSV